MNAEAKVVEIKRQAQRDSLFLSATIKVQGLATPITVRVRNLSNGGMMIDGNARLVPGQSVETDLRGIGPVSGIVAWVEAGRAGVAFDDMVDPKLARYQVGTAQDPAITKAPVIYDRRPGLKPRA
ncbi:hypothetical protein BH09PSE3_BH09PSE3_05770 [soil metagenome]